MPGLIFEVAYQVYYWRWPTRFTIGGGILGLQLEMTYHV